jgi:hypothetical protein
MNTVSNEPVAEINLDSLLSETTTNQDTIQNTETTN